MSEGSEPTRPPGSALEVLRVFLRLGLTSFGGPIAHLGYMKAELVDRRKWVSADAFADLVALCQFLPGPASSQLGMALGIERAGPLGGVAAWVGFTLPSALLMALFALGVGALDPARAAPWIHGLTIVAVPVVAIAIRGMAEVLCPDVRRAAIALAAAAIALAWPSPLAQIAILIAAGTAGWLDRERAEPIAPVAPAPIARSAAIAAAIAFVALLVGLPIASAALDVRAVDVADRFYRVGAMVFGGGHVVLPLLEREVVDPGWATHEQFLAGYGAVQAVPGPLFSLAAYLGFVLDAPPNGWAGAALALVAIFLPSYLLVVAALPFWSRLRASPSARAALRGTNAAVVGLLIAAFCDPVWTSAIHGAADVVIAAAALLALAAWRLSPWAVVPATAAASVLAGS